MKKFAVGFLTISLALLVGCSKGVNVSKEIDSSKPVIKVNQAVITQNMVDKILESVVGGTFLGQKNIDMKDPKNKFVYLIYKDKIVNELIVRELINQEAQKRNIKVSNEEVNKVIDGIAQKLGGKSKMEDTLAANNINKNDFINNIKMDLLTKKLVDNVAINTVVSDQDAKKFYDANKSTKFTYSDEVRAQHILISGSESDIKAKIEAGNPKLPPAQIDKKVQEEMSKIKAKAEKVLAEVKANSLAFNDFAKKYSEDPTSAPKGGDLGFFSKNQMVPAFSQAAFSLTPGQISGLVKTDFGYHIIRVVDRKKAGVTPFNELKPEIKQYLTDQNKMQRLQKIIESAKNTANITYLDAQYNPKNLQDEIKALVKSKQIPNLNQAMVGK